MTTIGIRDVYSNGTFYLVLNDDLFIYRDGLVFAGYKMYTNGGNLMVNVPSYSVVVKGYCL